MGQIINSVNNIYIICEKVAIEKKKKQLANARMDGIRENDPKLVENMIKMLEVGAHYIGDLTSVFNKQDEF